MKLRYTAPAAYCFIEPDSARVYSMFVGVSAGSGHIDR